MRLYSEEALRYTLKSSRRPNLKQHASYDALYLHSTRTNTFVHATLPCLSCSLKPVETHCNVSLPYSITITLSVYGEGWGGSLRIPYAEYFDRSFAMLGTPRTSIEILVLSIALV